MATEKATRKRQKNKWTCLANPCCVGILFTLSSVLVAWWYPWKPDSTHPTNRGLNGAQDHGTAMGSAELLKQTYLERELASLAYHGNLAAIQRLLHSDVHVPWVSYGLTTPIHHALRGRFDSLQEQSTQVVGHHEDVIAYLIGRGLNASQGCPIYYAVSYRNMVALEQLLKTSDRKSSLLCLTTQDTNGATALHDAAGTKASGFARFFAKLSGRDPSKELCSLLGVEPLKFRDQPGITLKQLNLALPPKDLELIFRELQPMLNLMEIRDSKGNSLLHSAAYGGRTDVVKLLLEKLPPNVVNHFNITPLHLAYAGQFCDVAQVLERAGADPLLADVANRTSLHMLDSTTCVKQRNPSPPEEDPRPPLSERSGDPPPDEEASSTTAWHRYLVSGWYSGLDSRLGRRCDFPVRNSSMGTEEFLLYHTGVYQPVLVRGLIQDWPAWKHWSYSELQRRYGSLVFSVSDVPYAQLYHGRSARTHRTTLADFVSLFTHKEEYPDYLFDGQVLQHNAALGHDAPVPNLIGNFTVTLKQLIIGPEHSGSPPHFHNHALNALVYGVKRWFLWPPQDAHFVFDHVGAWIKRKTGHYLECIQMPGDVIYVPQNWGHAVINEAPSIAVAFEFNV